MPLSHGDEHLQSRVWQQRAVIVLSLLALGLGVFGIATLHTAPVLLRDSGAMLSFFDANITHLDDIPLEREFFLRLPEFFTATAETRWWQLQEQVYDLLRTQRVVRITWTASDGRVVSHQVQVGFLSVWKVLTQTWLVYIVALIYLGNALVVFHRHRSPPGVVLTFFFLACALYFVCSAPVVYRSVTLPPVPFHVLIAVLQAAAGGLITLAHFAVIFPAPKPVLTRYPWLLALLYGYFALTVVLYRVGLTAFGTTFPLFCLWILVIVGAFLHSLLTERDPLIKQQINLSLTAPIFASLFAIFYLLPGVLGLPPVPLVYFALLSLIIPYALPLALYNQRLYHERLAIEQAKRETEQRAQDEKDQLQDDLHDLLMNNLVIIARTMEVTRTCLDQESARIEERLQATQDLATETARQLREFLWVIDDRHKSWDEFCAYLHGWGLTVVERMGLTFALEVAPAVLALPPPALPLRVCLYRVYREAIINALKHAQATQIYGRIAWCGESVRCEIQDNGIGFDPGATPPDHYGLRHLHKAVQALGGEMAIGTRAGEGTRLTVQLPLRKNTAIA
jgi:signal transduction histidine kinase